MMKKTLFVALLGLMTIANAMANVDFETLTITLKNNQVVTYHASALDSVRYVGGDFGTGIGVKIYLKNNTQSVDYLYSQITSFEKSQQEEIETPVISPVGGHIYSPTEVSITCATQGATIYYTTDNTTPSASSAPYTGSFIVSQTMTIKAIAIKGEVSSEIATATFTYSSGTDNNINANWHETDYGIPESGIEATSESATYNQAWRLEYPHINTSSNSMVVVHATSQYKISLSIEFDKSKRSNRWSCFTMHDGVPNNNVGRCASSFSTDSKITGVTQVTNNDYTTGNYTKSCKNLDGTNMTLFARGHVCASEDRQSDTIQNRHTFLTSNIHPQYQAHNGGLWSRMESKVQSWGYSSSFRDTLYVCKGATIADVNLNGTTSTGTISNSEVYNLYGVDITGTMTIPRYWYMAVLCLKNGAYHAMAFWTEQTNSAGRNVTLSSCVISIDELERRTGIDFFCNLPDDIEDAVEATVETSFWNVGN